MSRPQFSLKSLLWHGKPTKRGYIGGFVWAFVGDSGDDGMSWEPLAGALLGGVLGCGANQLIPHYALPLVGTFAGLLLGAVIVAIRFADEPRPTSSQSGTQE